MTNDILSYITNDIVIDIMKENGSPLYGRGTTSDGKEYLVFKTICHGGNSEKLYYYSESKTFHCWTNCGTMSFFTLVQKILHLDKDDFYGSLKYIANKVGFSLVLQREQFNGLTISQKEMLRFCEDAATRQEQYEEFLNSIQNPYNSLKGDRYDESIMDYFDHKSFYSGWIDEGITIKTMKRYNIAFYWLDNSIIIPHYGKDKYLLGIRRRSLNPEDSKNKYMPLIVQDIPYGHALGLNLYGICQNEIPLRDSSTAIIVEGEKSVLLADSYDQVHNNAVATCGFNVSSQQIDLLEDLGVKTIYLGFDKDYDDRMANVYDDDTYEEYRKYKEKIISIADKFYRRQYNVYIIIDKKGLLGPKDSPMDKGKEVYEELKRSAVKYAPNEQNQREKEESRIWPITRTKN